MSEVPSDVPQNRTEAQSANQELASAPANGSFVADSQPTLWHSLREAREARGLSIAEVAHYLKFTPKQVEAMETGALKQLPGPAFTRGFVRNYARFLQLDVRPFMAALDPVNEDMPLQSLTPRLGDMPSSSQTMTRFPALPALAATLALLALVVAGWYFSWFEPRDEAFLADVYAQSDASVASAPVAASAPADVATEVATAVTSAVAESAPLAASAPVAQSAPVAGASVLVAPIKSNTSAPVATPAAALPASAPVATRNAVVVVQSAPVAARIASTSEPLDSSRKPLASGQLRVVLGFNSEAWVEVRDATDKIIFSRLNDAGSKQEIQGEAPLSLVIGNAQEVRLSYNGKAVDLTPYTKVNVARVKLP